MVMPTRRPPVLAVRARSLRERAANEMVVAALFHGQLVVRRDGDRLVATPPPAWSGDDPSATVAGAPHAF